MARANLTLVIAERDGWVCNGCGQRVEPWTLNDTPQRYATVDHKDPRGGDDPSNLWLMCSTCNSSKGDSSLDEWEKTLDFDSEFLRKGFTCVPNNLLENASLSLGARMTLICLMSFAWKGDPFPGQARLGEMLGCTERTIRDYLSELKKAGFLKVHRRGRGRTNVYRISTKTLMRIPEKSSGQQDQDRKPASALDRKPASGPMEEDEVEEGSAVANATAAHVPEEVSAQTLIATFIDNARASGADPPRRVIGQLAKEVKKLIEEGAGESELHAALERLRERSLNPSSLASVLFDVRQRGGPSANGRNVLDVFLAEHNGQWPTGTRLVRGQSGATFVRDPLGYDKPNHAVPWGRPNRDEIVQALRGVP